MLHKYTFVVLISCLPFQLSAQMITDTFQNGSVFQRDPRFDLLVNKRAEINQQGLLEAEIEIPKKGFRVQAMSTSNRTDVLNAKSKILSIYPQHKVYLIYQAPLFKLRIGNFIEREEAVELKNELAKFLPPGIIVIPSEIELTKKEQEAYREKMLEERDKSPDKKSIKKN
jgi:hypothetical protein